MPRERRLHGLLSAAVAYGLVPDFTLAVGAGLSAEWGWLGGRLVFSYLLPRSHHDGTEGLRSGALGLSGTFDVLATRWLKLGLGGDFYLMHARGLGVSASRSDWATLATLHAGLGLRLFGRKRWALEAQARGLFAAQPSRFVIRGRPPVYTTKSFGFQLGLGWSWRFL
jgi:hypothetical protein